VANGTFLSALALEGNWLKSSFRGQNPCLHSEHKRLYNRTIRGPFPGDYNGGRS